ncbi:Mth938-like domain-containing protein [Chitinilyticum piscinae]|uniref:Mth938-like domain-containing protein n=1 Tax=Chitinilyticum piscinae TaxID=2866724 RepID=A0A8J7G0W7_9NEIS|nr:Mth938-like domain-containing protein [Chitinilyticum piscinae]MBE9609935.1 Mth938-like domain-containing protein [Chitinilyticum piscinae]
MKLHQSKVGNLNQFTSYGEDFVEVNRQRHQGPVLVSGEQVLPWSARSLESLAPADIEAILALNPEVVLIGTGKHLRFGHPQRYAALSAARIGVDFLDNGALCRTFNILSAEGRQVVAAVLYA